MDTTPFTFENWFTRAGTVEFEDGNYYDFRRVLSTVFGDAGVLLFMQEDDYQGTWVAVVTDGEDIALIDGSFGSCEGCDALMDCSTGAEVKALTEEYLRSVRTFTDWSSVVAYFEALDRDPWTWRWSRDQLLAFARVGMPLQARDILARLRADNPDLGARELATMASALH